MAQDFNNEETFVDQVKEYVNTRLAQLKLSFAEKTSKVIAIMIAVIMLALVFFSFPRFGMCRLCHSHRSTVGKFLARVPYNGGHCVVGRFFSLDF
jgi:hypothetical protein